MGKISKILLRAIIYTAAAVFLDFRYVARRLEIGALQRRKSIPNFAFLTLCKNKGRIKLHERHCSKQTVV